MTKFLVALAIVTVGLSSALRIESDVANLRRKKPDAVQAPFRAGGDVAGAPGSLQPTQQPADPVQAGAQVLEQDLVEDVEAEVIGDGAAEEITGNLGPNEEVEEVIEPDEAEGTTWGVLEKDKPFPGMAISQMPTLNVHQPMQEMSPALTRAMMKGGEDDVPYMPDGLPMDPSKAGGDGDGSEEGGLNEPWVGHAIKAMPPCPTCSDDCPAVKEAEEEEAGGEEEEPAEPAPIDQNVLVPVCPRCLCNEPEKSGTRPAPEKAEGAEGAEGEEEEGEGE